MYYFLVLRRIYIQQMEIMKLERALIFLCLNGSEENATQNRDSQYWITNFVGCWLLLLLVVAVTWNDADNSLKKNAQSNLLCGKVITKSSARNKCGEKVCESGDGKEYTTRKGTLLALKYTKPRHYKYSCSAQFTILEQQAFFSPNIQRTFFHSRPPIPCVLGVLSVFDKITSISQCATV